LRLNVEEAALAQASLVAHARLKSLHHVNARAVAERNLLVAAADS
jgi:hypothetical protein